MRVLLLMLLALPASIAIAKQAPPRPPVNNPHPPTTPEEHAKVAFAELAVKSFLSQLLVLPEAADAANRYANKDQACFGVPKCYGADAAFVRDLRQFYEGDGIIVESKHTHVVPNTTPQPGSKSEVAPIKGMQPLAADEHAVHLYARFSRSGWQDVSVILHQDASGKLFLRRFLAVPLGSLHKLPPGAKC